MVNIGVVGLSAQGLQHIEAIRAHKDFNLVSICDRNELVLYEAARRLDCDAFNNIDSMLDTVAVDALILCLPHHEYEAVIEKAFTKGIHVLKEKPLARNLEEARKFLSKARDYGVRFGVAAQRRFHRPYRVAKEALPLIGTPRWVRVTHCDNIVSRRSGWRASKDLAGGGALLDIGYHLLNIATWYFGKPEQIYLSIMQSDTLIAKIPNQVEETAFVVMGFPKNATCEIFVSRQSSPKAEQITINGSQGHLQISRTALELFSLDGAVLDKQDFEPGWSDAMRSQLDDFHRLLDDDEDCLTSAQSHFASLEIIQAIYDSGMES